MTDGATGGEVLGGNAQGQLRSIIERIERMEIDKADVAADIKAVYGEAKGSGFSTQIIRKVVQIRKMDTAKRQEQEAMLDLYLTAIGGA